MFGWLSGSDNGRTLRYAAVGSAVSVLIALSIGAGAERYASSDDHSLLALFSPHEDAKSSPARFNAIDYATTGSIGSNSKLVVIGPCAVDQK